MSGGTGSVNDCPIATSGMSEYGSVKSSRAGTAHHWGKWPLRSYLELAALPSAVPCARLHARALLWEWGLPDSDGTAELVVSELTTNAVEASAGLTGSRYDGRWSPGTPPVRVWLCSDRQRVVAAGWGGR